MKIEKPAAYYDEIFSKPYNSNLSCVYGMVLNTLSDRVPAEAFILEIGCGVGELGKMLIPHFPNYLGVDFSMVAIDHCRKEVSESHFALADIYDAEIYQRKAWDVVVGIEVLEHVRDREVVQLLPSGAFVLFSFPSYNSEAHLRTYSLETIQDRLNDLIEIEKIDYLEIRKNSNIFLISGQRGEG